MEKLVLDHIAVLGRSLAEATSHAERTLGQPLSPGGIHARFGTHNQLIALAPDLYLEAIAVDPSAPNPQDARWFGLDSFSGPARLDKWICRVADLDAALAVFPMAGRPVPLERGALRWRMAVPEDGALPFDGVFPALIQWQSPVPPGKALTASGLTLERLTVTHPEIEALEALLVPHLDAPLVRFARGARAGLTAQVKRPDGIVTLT